jgi:hypothetical protein
VFVTYQPWDEISQQMIEERSEIEGKMKNMLCHFHRDYRHLRSQNPEGGMNDTCDVKGLAFTSLLFLKGQKAIHVTSETVTKR